MPDNLTVQGPPSGQFRFDFDATRDDSLSGQGSNLKSLFEGRDLRVIEDSPAVSAMARLLGPVARRLPTLVPPENPPSATTAAPLIDEAYQGLRSDEGLAQVITNSLPYQTMTKALEQASRQAQEAIHTSGQLPRVA